MTDVTTTEEIVLDISDEALFKVLDVRAAEEEGDALALRVEVTGVEGVDYAYDLAFEPISEATDTDVIYAIGEMTVIVPENSTGVCGTRAIWSRSGPRATPSSST